MKKQLMILIFLAIPLLLSAQVMETESFFREYSGVVGYKTVCLAQKMLQMSAGAENSMIGDIDKITILTSANDDPDMIRKIKAIADRNYELVSFTDDSGDVTSFHLAVPKCGKKSFLMIAVRRDKDIVLEITGDYKIEDISKLSQLSVQK